jgi:hypothetical protein
VYGWGVQGCFRTDPEKVSLGVVLRVSDFCSPHQLLNGSEGNDRCCLI